MILNFDEYKKMLIEDDDYLFEAMSISTETSEETERVVEFINSQIDSENISVIDHKDSDGKNCDVIKFKKVPEIDIFGCKCEVSIIIKNYVGDIDKDVYKYAPHMTMRTFSFYENNVTKLKFELTGDVILVNGKLTEKVISILAHELRHAYVSKNIYGDVSMITAEKRRKLNMKWKKIYGEALSYIRYFNNDIFMQLLDGNSFYKILFSIYNSDVSEIAAFTQQAYEYCKNCKDIESVKSKMKETELYEMKVSFKNIITFLCDKEVAITYENKKEKYSLYNLPNLNELIKLFEKRYRKIYKNYGKVIAYLYEEIEGDKGKLVDVR